MFLSLLTWNATVPLVVQLLSYDIRLAKSHLIYKYPDPQDAEPSTNWHRDFMESPFDLGPHRYPRMLIKIAYQLTDTSALSGNTILLPGSNNLTRRLQIPEGRNDPDGAVELELQAGDAFLFESRTFHRVGLNRTDVPRKCLMMGYCYGWISPLDYDVQPDWLLDKVTDPDRAPVDRRTQESQHDNRPVGAPGMGPAARRRAFLRYRVRASAGRVADAADAGYARLSHTFISPAPRVRPGVVGDQGDPISTDRRHPAQQAGVVLGRERSIIG